MNPANILKPVHARRLREMYRSAGWPCHDVIEIELLAAGLLERLPDAKGVECMRVTDSGIAYLAKTAQGNRERLSAHNQLVERMVDLQLREGRVVWTGLTLRAHVPADTTAVMQWRMCMPDVFSIRNTTVETYLEPVVHEVKVSRADLLGDLKKPDKRAAYLEIGGQVWYVLGCNAKGHPIAKAHEIPSECGVMVALDGRLEVERPAPKRPASMPFHMWMALAKAVPVAMGTPEANRF